mmetsp:Transcript_42874/g.115374  ORF Transcript_42874/g.115374 Transcript_42874/m.115374 type:complete len:282 (-) Transcript_42874:1149-1994(-)
MSHGSLTHVAGRLLESEASVRSSGIWSDGASARPGTDVKAPQYTPRNLDFSGAKLVTAICRFSSCMADSHEPAAMWSAAWDELLTQCEAARVPACGAAKKSPPSSSAPPTTFAGAPRPSRSSSPKSRSSSHPPPPPAAGSAAAPPPSPGMSSSSMRSSSPHAPPAGSPKSSSPAANASAVSARLPSNALLGTTSCGQFTLASSSFTPRSFSLPSSVRMIGVGGCNSLAPAGTSGTSRLAASSSALIRSASSSRPWVIAVKYARYVCPALSRMATRSLTSPR